MNTSQITRKISAMTLFRFGTLRYLRCNQQGKISFILGAKYLILILKTPKKHCQGQQCTKESLFFGIVQLNNLNVMIWFLEKKQHSRMLLSQKTKLSAATSAAKEITYLSILTLPLFRVANQNFSLATKYLKTCRCLISNCHALHHLMCTSN